MVRKKAQKYTFQSINQAMSTIRELCNKERKKTRKVFQLKGSKLCANIRAETQKKKSDSKKDKIGEKESTLDPAGRNPMKLIRSGSNP